MFTMLEKIGVEDEYEVMKGPTQVGGREEQLGEFSKSYNNNKTFFQTFSHVR